MVKVNFKEGKDKKVNNQALNHFRYYSLPPPIHPHPSHLPTPARHPCSAANIYFCPEFYCECSQAKLMAMPVRTL